MEAMEFFFGTFASVLLLYFHLVVNQSGLKKGAELVVTELRRFLSSPTLEEIQHKRRIEEELHKTRLQIFKVLNSCAIHVDFCLLLRTCWKIGQRDETTIFELCHGTIPYMFFTIFHSLSLIDIKGMWRIYEILALTTHVTLSFLHSNDAGFDSAGKFHLICLIGLSSSMLNSRVSVPFCCLDGLIAIYKSTKTWACESGTSECMSMVQDEVAIYGLTCFLVVMIEHLTRLHIEYRLQSGDHACRLTGFRAVLRGVCDGDILLDSKQNVLEDATCLERLLNLKRKLSGTNFSNLFFGVEDRKNFQEFLSNSSHSKPESTPPAYRVTLQGAVGPVSLDLFHVRLVKVSSQADEPEGTCHLLAIKQDADQSAIPDADEAQGAPLAPHVDTVSIHRHGTTVSSSSDRHLERSYDNLKEVSLLLTSHSPSWDISELHVKYQRRSYLDCSMPTLRNFIKCSDWERIQQKLREAQRCGTLSDSVHFTKAVRFRLPGRSDKYLRSKKVSVGRVSDADAEPLLFWMNLQDFEFGQMQRTQRLDGINET